MDVLEQLKRSLFEWGEKELHASGAGGWNPILYGQLRYNGEVYEAKHEALVSGRAGANLTE